MRIVTDSTPVEAPKNPDSCNLFQIYRLFLDKAGQQALRQRYLAGGTGYGEIKEELFVTIRDYFAPFTERRNALLQDSDQLRQTLQQGADKARREAVRVMRKVRKKAGLAY
jgi:tryptophanyl-tRNA synthetase